MFLCVLLAFFIFLLLFAICICHAEIKKIFAYLLILFKYQGTLLLCRTINDVCFVQFHIWNNTR